ncbi:hypothetical protein [Domibacillus indicus]|uniref:hypothetical protein n=1 Tax=Domibacillus indicus TaxID=1437523 RepID=UPI0006182BB3|nr:hypothetical protein [Domibacillus indicus]
MIYIAAAAAVIVGIMLGSRLLSGYKIKEGRLVVKTGSQETSILLKEIVEVFEMDEVSEDASFFEKYIVRAYMKKKRVAVYTRSNVSYFFILRNPGRLVKSVKVQNPNVHIKAKVI